MAKPPRKSRPARAMAAPAASARRTPRPFTWVAGLILTGLVFGVYANSFSNDFVFDDHTLVDFNPEVNPGVRQALERKAIDYRPFRIASYTLDRKLFGHRPAAYRFGNAVYHTLSGWAALIVYRQLGFHPTTALLAAAFFVVHPVQTESVAYISGRRDVLCGLFMLVAFSCYLRWRSRAGRWWHAVVGLAAAALGVLSKEVAFALPVVLVAHDLLRAVQRHGNLSALHGLLAAVRDRWRPYGALALAGAAALGVYLALEGLPSHQDWWGGSVISNYLNVALLWVHAGVLMLFPLRLLADYSYEAVELVRSAADPLAWVAVAVLTGLLGFTLAMVRRAPRAVFLVWWAALTLLPSSHVLPHHDFFAEHYLYVPLFGFCGVLALLMARAGQRLRQPRRAIALAGTIVLCLYGARTVARNRDWRDDLTLWRVTADAAPGCARALANYGGALLGRYQMDRIDEAARYLRRSRKIKPLITATSGLAMITHVYGDFTERNRLLARLKRARKVSYANLMSLAGWFLQRQDYATAIDLAQAATTRAGADDRGLTIEGWARVHLGQLDAGCALFRRALRINPVSADARRGQNWCTERGHR